MKLLPVKWTMALRRPWNRLPAEMRLVVVVGILAVVVGLAAVLFEHAVHWLSEITIQDFVTNGTVWFLVAAFISVVLGSTIATFIVRKFDPSCAGGGVMPTKLAYWKKHGFMPFRTGLVKFLGSAITLGSGVSMGPEGPAVQMGAAVMSSAAGAMGVPQNKRRAYAAAGAAASLAAVFNAPLTAIAFVLEEIIGNLSSRLVGVIVLAAVVGALVAHALVGPQPAFQVAPLQDASWRGMVLCPFVAVFASFAGVGFQRGAMAVRGRFKRLQKIPVAMQPVLGAVGTWVLGGAAFLLTGHIGVFGVGYADVTACISGQLSWGTTLVLGIAKLGATLIAVGTANCGGIFAPNLFIGAMCGGAIAGLAKLTGHVFPLTESDQAMLVMAGMCACLGAVIRTPVTCILLIFEVTHQFVVVPLLLVATIISQFVSRKMSHEGIYEEMMRQDGENPDRVLPPRDYERWRELPCAELLRSAPIVVTSLEPAALTQLLEASKHGRFPVRTGGDHSAIEGILTRREVQRALREKCAPQLTPVSWVSPSTTLMHAQVLVMNAPENMLCVGDHEKSQLLGVLTAHDLLREQIALVEDEVSD